MPKKVKRGSSRKKRQPRRSRSSFFNILSAVVVTTFLLVVVTGAIKWVNERVTSEAEPHSEMTEASGVSEVVVSSEENGQEIATISVMADSEDDVLDLQKALEISVQKDVGIVLYLGDYTGWGDIESLEKARTTMEGSGLPYVSLPGDHDLAAAVQQGDTSGLINFRNVFGESFHTLVLGGSKLVLLDNSANYSKISSDLISKFYSQLSDADFVFLSQPLYHPTFKRTMGIVEGEEISEVKAQADELLNKIRESNVKAIISADQHLFSRNVDPVDSTLEHIVVGALTSERNLQTPRFLLLKLFEDGGYEVEEVVL